MAAILANRPANRANSLLERLSRSIVARELAPDRLRSSRKSDVRVLTDTIRFNGIGAASPPSGSKLPRHKIPRRLMNKTIAIVVFPGVQALDVSGPMDVFAEANRFLDRKSVV